jgi:hypothetical protein
MRFEPQRTRGAGRIEPDLLPPPCFITMTMELAVMSPAQWDGELVTGFAAERAVLRKTQMMRVARLTSAD